MIDVAKGPKYELAYRMTWLNVSEVTTLSGFKSGIRN